jgi:hypothetical protein
MQPFLYAGLGFFVAAFLSGLELLTASYPRTYFLVFRSGALWGYAIVYGVIAALLTFGADYLIASGKLKLEGMILGANWFRAVAIGISVKSLLHINLFNITTGSQSVPIGIETLTKLFEPQLLRAIVFDEFNAVRRYLEPYCQRYTTLQNVKSTIGENVPPTLPIQESQAFETELAKAATVMEAMERGLRFLGRKTFKRIFPL